MKLHQIFRIAGLISGLIGAILIICGVIGFLTGEFLGVIRFSNFFWYANTFLMFAIFASLVFIGCTIKEKFDGDK
jgi:preprotein translocase subunit SecD